MSTPVTALMAVLIVVCCLSMPTMGYGQGTELIQACVNAKGSLRIVAPGTSCSAKETLLTWPAEPAEPTTFYQRVSASVPVFEQTFATAVALCDEPDDLAVGGGFKTDNLPVNDMAYHVITSAPCEASGLCAGSSGRDGWVVVAKSTNPASAGHLVTAYVICATP